MQGAFTAAFVAVLLACCAQLSLAAVPSQLSVDSMTSQLKSSLEALGCGSLRSGASFCSEPGVQDLWNKYDMQTKTLDIADANTGVPKYTARLEAVLQKRKLALEKIVEKAEKLFLDEDSVSPESSTGYFMGSKDKAASTLQKNLARGFGPVEISDQHSTWIVPDGISTETTAIDTEAKITSGLDSTFRDNFNTDPRIKWQYFGSVTGMWRQYPGAERGRSFSVPAASRACVNGQSLDTVPEFQQVSGVSQRNPFYPLEIDGGCSSKANCNFASNGVGAGECQVMCQNKAQCSGFEYLSKRKGTQQSGCYFYSGSSLTVSGTVDIDRTCYVKGQYSSYDPRYRPWYTESASGPKNVVLLLDKSGSMNTNPSLRRMEMMREAAVQVLDSLTSDDWFQVVFFSSDALTIFDEAGLPQTGNDANLQRSFGCGSPQTATEKNDEFGVFGKQLVRATPANVRIFREWVQSVNAAGGTNFGAGFEKIGEFLDNTKAAKQGTNCQTAIIFLSDGEPAAGAEGVAQLQTILDKHDDVTVFGFALGGGADTAAMDRLTDKTPLGSTVLIQDGDGSLLRSKMAGYFESYSDVTRLQSKQFWTSAYVDSSGLGLMVTIAQPVFVCGIMRGVAGIDVTIADMFNEVEQFQFGPNDYNFLVNNEGEVIWHPRLIDPKKAATADLEQMPDIASLEGPEFATKEFAAQSSCPKGTLRDLITAPGDCTGGFYNLETTQYLSRGNAEKEGVLSTDAFVTYGFRVLSGFPFTFGFAGQTADNPASNDITTLSFKSSTGDATAVCDPSVDAATKCKTDSIYHRLDLAAAPECADCANYKNLGAAENADYNNALITHNHTTFKLAPWVFNDPESYTQVDETSNNMREMWTIVNTGDGSAVGQSARLGKGWPEDVTRDVQITSGVEPLWLAAYANATNNQTVWRYVATTNGAMRIFPGAVIKSSGNPRTYDPTARTWFKRALANEDTSFTLSSPYIDAFGAGVVVTLASTIKLDTSVQAVAGADIKLSELKSLVDSAAASQSVSCLATSNEACFLIDQNGYFVYHPMFDQFTSPSDQDLEFKFLGDIVGPTTTNSQCLATLTKFFFKNDILVKDGPVKNYQSFTTDTTYQLDDTKINAFSGAQAYDSASADKFFMEKIANTNVYFLHVSWNTADAHNAQLSADRKRAFPKIDINNGWTQDFPPPGCTRVSTDGITVSHDINDGCLALRENLCDLANTNAVHDYPGAVITFCPVTDEKASFVCSAGGEFWASSGKFEEGCNIKATGNTVQLDGQDFPTYTKENVAKSLVCAQARDDEEGVGAGAVAGIAIGVVIGVVVLLFCAFRVFKSRQEAATVRSADRFRQRNDVEMQHKPAPIVFAPPPQPVVHPAVYTPQIVQQNNFPPPAPAGYSQGAAPPAFQNHAEPAAEAPPAYN